MSKARIEKKLFRFIEGFLYLEQEFVDLSEFSVKGMDFTKPDMTKEFSFPSYSC